MYLKSLTMKGFKSFASSTTLQLEPGITCVVGPNGSGKSNVVDALAWVMGEQGAKSLRGGKMEDVIFAGTSERAPLGRAEVILTIDNSDGALPIDYTEVTISRIMFRSGGSEYAINGEPCRLLDIQELLSDSGIGREMHVIVGQNQLDQILGATPEERRGFIEEAAGVLKHRKRKEKALRKLEAMQGNLLRLTDLTTELRRQLTPLGKQAEVARRAQVIQIDVRDSRSRLMADDLVQLREALAAEVADETALRDKRAEVETDLSGLQAREAVLEAEMRADAPLVARSQETWFRLSSLRERFNGTISLAAERVRVLSPVEEESFGRDPDELDAEARDARTQANELAQEVERARGELEKASQQRVAAEGAFAEEVRRLEDISKAASHHREGLTRLAGQVDAMRQRIETRTAEISRLEDQIAAAQQRADAAQQEFLTRESEIAGLNTDEAGLDEAYELAAAALARAEDTLNDLKAREQQAERERLGFIARVEALEMALANHGGGAVLLAASSSVSGVLGSVASLIKVRSGFEDAIATALGEAANAVVVADVDSAVSAFEHLKASEAGRAGVVIANSGASTAWDFRDLPAGAVVAADVVEAPDHIRSAISALLRNVVIVQNLRDARQVISHNPDAVAVTTTGDVLGAAGGSGGSSSAPSVLQMQSALDEARGAAEERANTVSRVKFEQVAAAEAVKAAAREADSRLSVLHESDAEMAAVAEQLGHLASTVRNANAEADRLKNSLSASVAALTADQGSLQELQTRLESAQSVDVEVEPSTDVRDQLNAAVEVARQTEVDARLAVRTNEERQRAAATTADGLERAARDERESRRRFAERKERRAHESAVAASVLKGAQIAVSWLDVSLQQASNERASAERTRDARDAELTVVRSRMRELGQELERLVSDVHRDEVARAEQRLRIEALENKAMEELGLDAETLIAEFGPHNLVPPSPPAPGDEVDPNAPAPEPYPYVREQQEKRLKQAERGLNLLGKVNPLALEEFAALEERHQFLNAQLDDLRKSKNDLMAIIKDVDERVQQVFAEAFADTAREFEVVFSRLFPGGEGRLVLTDPDDLLTSGIEVEARPPGKKLKRLSLLSGGERSLTAVAFLVALFKARPSPFYVMDEVEAALDDVNLGRLIDVMKELQVSSQLIVITHQKRTMEIADALYGVTMRGDGVSAVISQRLADVRENA